MLGCQKKQISENPNFRRETINDEWPEKRLQLLLLLLIYHPWLPEIIFIAKTRNFGEIIEIGGNWCTEHKKLQWTASDEWIFHLNRSVIGHRRGRRSLALRRRPLTKVKSMSLPNTVSKSRGCSRSLAQPHTTNRSSVSLYLCLAAKVYCQVSHQS